MTKLHKDVAEFMVQLAENSSITETEVISQIAMKTDELLSHLKTFALTKTMENKSVITLDTLRAEQLNPINENFWFNLAIAENMMML